MPQRWQRLGRWVLVSLLAVVGLGAAALKPLGWDWPWLLATLAAIAAVLVLPGKLATSSIEGAAKRKAERRQTLQGGALDAARRRVKDYIDPIELGVHRAFLPEGYDPADELSASVPVYVPRDQHEAVVQKLTPGAFVLILGDSGAGKTRLAFEAIKAALPNHRLICPDRAALPAALDEMAELRNAVLWLDDLENYLGPSGLTPVSVNRILSGPGHNRVIVATLRLQELNRIEADDDRLLGEDRRKVLARADTIRLARTFTEPEMQRARNRSHDPRIAEAIAHADQYGLAEYLGAGPQLLQRWQNGWSPRTHPRGAALVQTAIDCRRAGYLGPLPKALLNDNHQHYLDTDHRLHPEPLPDAWTWALTPWRDTAALLEETSDTHVTVFDYLVDHIQRITDPTNHVPDHLITATIHHANPTDLSNIGRQCTRRDGTPWHTALTLRP